MIKPAVDGTLVVLRACVKHGVKRVVLTSSAYAIFRTHEDKRPSDGVHNESHFSDPSRKGGMTAYEASKALAEKAAWEYLDSLPEHQKFELTTICPGLVIGPSLIAGGFTSGKLISDLMNNEFPALPHASIPCVDVRNVVQAHVRAIKTDSA